jgi:hypothetical protein
LHDYRSKSRIQSLTRDFDGVGHSEMNYSVQDLAFDEVDQDGEDHCQSEELGLPSIARPQAQQSGASR